MTPADIRQIAPTARGGLVGPLAKALTQRLPEYDIDTPLRQAHFMAQAAHETDGFRTLEEYASGKAYEGRKDLGNVVAGDGVRFKGRGIFQLTGRVNYQAYGKRLGLDLVGDPELAADPDVSVRVACEFWKAKGLNTWADRDDVDHITRRINGGTNGLADRKAKLAKAKRVFDCDETMPLGIAAMPDEEVPDAPIAATAPKSLMQSTEAQGGALAFVIAAKGFYADARDFVGQFIDHPEQAAMQLYQQHPQAVMFAAIGAVALFVVWRRWRRLQEGC